ncbi:MAG: hypothetical protein IH840_06970 [Candidatus Heimdallarchaeota archaeon]|nr:hypothetical protein [Candidatus Heimdallarchaeota archaeon]
MSEIPMEYKMMKKKFSKGVEKALGENLVGIVVYGGSASERIFSGVSDIDFFIILKRADALTKPLSAIYGDLSKSVLEFFENPLFSSILDYDIYLEDQLPSNGNFNGFSPIRAISLREGELLTGTNPFAGMDIPDVDLKNGARRMVQDYLEKLSSVLFMPSFEITPEGEEAEEDTSLDVEKEFLAVDAILSSIQAYHIFTKKKYVNMPDLVLFAETEPVEGIDNDLLMKAGLLRQGVDADVENFFDRALDFCGDVIKLLR